jgi:hypothetical protein
MLTLYVYQSKKKRRKIIGQPFPLPTLNPWNEGWCLVFVVLSAHVLLSITQAKKILEIMRFGLASGCSKMIRTQFYSYRSASSKVMGTDRP